MGQYRLSFYFKMQVGFLIRYDKGCSIDIEIPFISIYIGLLDCAEGVRFFKD